MAENTKIEWASHSWNPWRGCTRVSEGCRFCYAETLSGRNPKTLGVWGPGGTRVVAAEAQWKLPLKWDKAAGFASLTAQVTGCDPLPRPRVFCASLADVFEDWRGDMTMPNGDVAGREVAGGGMMKLTMQDVRNRLFALIDATPHLDWLVLTKRPENVARMMPPVPCTRCFGGPCDTNCPERGRVRPNVWLGTSVENQAAADDRIPHLLRVPAAVRFLSCEPLLGPIEFSNASRRSDAVEQLGKPALNGIHWVIAGGESGPDSRTCRVEWLRSLRDQCKAVGVAFFCKQLGARVTTTLPPGESWPGHPGPLQFSGDGFGNYHALGLIDRKGGTMDEWPADLRVREFPGR